MMREMQRAWITSRDKSCGFIYDYFEGSMANPMIAACQNRETGRRALRRSPGDSATHILVAQSLLRQNKVDEALAELETIPEEDRGAEAHYALGRLFSKKREWEEARELQEEEEEEEFEEEESSAVPQCGY